MRGWMGACAATLVSLAIAAAQSESHRVAAAPAVDAVRAPERLEDTGLYALGRPGVVDVRNRSFSPQYPLWSDGAAKSRWVYFPSGSAIDATDVGDWDLPVGTRFWKEFRFGDRKVETRFLWKASPARWIAASYVWNADGSAAVLAPEGGEPGVLELTPGRWHSIPSVQDCHACHGSGARTRPLGFNALQLSTDRDPAAIHGEPLSRDMLTLKTLVDEQLLSPARAELVADPPRIRTSHPLTRTVLGYLAANCGSCHDGRGDIAVTGPSLKHSDVMSDGDAVARNLVSHATTWQVPGVLEGASVLVDTSTPELSALLVRMRSRRPSSQMPPLGTVLRDQAAVDAMARWIATDLTNLKHSAAKTLH